jgi:DNA-binding PadR family transcriptional regulator
MSKKISVQEALDALSLHHIVEKCLLKDGKVGYQMTDKGVELLKDNLYEAYKKNPKEDKESLKIQGLVLTALEIGHITEKDLPVFVDVIDQLMEPAN